MAEFVEFRLLPLKMVFFCMNFENYPISVHCFLSAQCNAQFIEVMRSIKLNFTAVRYCFNRLHLKLFLSVVNSFVGTVKFCRNSIHEASDKSEK